MTLRCLLGAHEPGGVVARANVLHLRCARCQRLSPGWVIDAPPPRVTYPAKPKPRLWWLRGVFTKGA
jgi:hypothetical protein